MMRNSFLPLSEFRLSRALTLLALATAISFSVSCRSPREAAVAPLPNGMLPSQAQVVEVRGFDNQGKNPGGSWHRLRLGDWLAMGAVVRTSPTSKLTLRLYQAGVMVQLKPSSRMILTQLSYSKETGTTSTVLDLPQGEVVVDDAHLPPGSDFEIHTPQGVTRIPQTGQK